MVLILQDDYCAIAFDYGRVDLHQVDESHEHQLAMHAGEDCVCLVFIEGPTIHSSFFAKSSSVVHGHFITISPKLQIYLYSTN